MSNSRAPNIPRLRLLQQLLAAIATAALALAGARGNELHVCAVLPDKAGTDISDSALLERAALALAVHDVGRAAAGADSSEYCGLLLGPCQRLADSLSVGNMSLELSIWDSTNMSAQDIALAIKECHEVGGGVVVGYANGEAAKESAVVASLFGIPFFGHAATSPSLDAKELPRGFARTSFSDGSRVRALVSLFEMLGWEKVALLHRPGVWGDGMREVLEKQAELETMTVSVAGGPQSKGAVANSMSTLSEMPHKVVVLLLCDVREVEEVASLAVGKHLLDFQDHVWVDACGALESLTESNSQISDAIAEWAHGTLSLRINSEQRSTELQAAANESPGMIASTLEAARQTSSSAEEGHASAAGVGSLSVQGCAANIYDTVWALAAAWALAAEASAPNPPGAAEVVAQLSSVEFDGVSGHCSWDSSGTRIFDRAVVVFDNYRRSEEGELAAVAVGQWSLSDGSVLQLDHAITWPDGSAYPRVPLHLAAEDGWSRTWTEATSCQIALLAMGSALALVVLCVAVALVAMRRQLRLPKRSLSRGQRNMVHSPSLVDLDLRSPTMRIIEFLERCTQNENVSKEEAAELRRLVVHRSEHLAEPVGLLEQMRGRNFSYSDDIINYIHTSIRTPSETTTCTMSGWSAKYQVGESPQGVRSSFSVGGSARSTGLSIRGTPPSATCETRVEPVALQRLFPGAAEPNPNPQPLEASEDDLAVFLSDQSPVLRPVPVDAEASANSTDDPEQQAVEAVSCQETDTVLLLDAHADQAEEAVEQGEKSRRRPSRMGSGRFHIDPEMSFKRIIKRQRSNSGLLAAAHPFGALDHNFPEKIAQIGQMMFFDFITGESIFLECQNPLYTVVKNCIRSAGLSKLLKKNKAQEKLLNLVAAVEDGYVDTGYHSKLHAADVTSRLMSMVKLAGVAVDDHWTRLGIMFAAAVHDYQHPQVNNQFLIVQVSSRGPPPTPSCAAAAGLGKASARLGLAGTELRQNRLAWAWARCRR